MNVHKQKRCITSRVLTGDGKLPTPKIQRTMELTIQTVNDKRKNITFFKVICGDRSTGKMYYSEMIGLISALTMPDERPTELLLTEQQHQEINKYLEQ
jgi:hypothetical protein